MSKIQGKKKRERERETLSDNSTLIHSFKNYLTSSIKNIACENTSMHKKANLKYQQVQ